MKLIYEVMRPYFGDNTEDVIDLGLLQWDDLPHYTGPINQKLAKYIMDKHEFTIELYYFYRDCFDFHKYLKDYPKHYDLEVHDILRFRELFHRDLDKYLDLNKLGYLWGMYFEAKGLKLYTNLEETVAVWFSVKEDHPIVL